MAKRKREKKNKFNLLEFWQKNPGLVLKIGLVVVIIISAMFGFSYGYPIAAQGDVVKGVLTGLAYGGGALIAVLISYFLNRKLKGL